MHVLDLIDINGTCILSYTAPRRLKCWHWSKLAFKAQH